MEKEEKVYMLAEKLGWNSMASHEGDTTVFYFQRYTKQMHVFSFQAEMNNNSLVSLAKNVMDYWGNFVPEYETNKRIGKAGHPNFWAIHHIGEIRADMEEAQAELEKFAFELNKIASSAG